ncbi:MAG TPA: bifunctional nuclease family protein [Opitutales bacterium]|nr:bifunctional nuclease family protein [Opitutales bacterium]
MEYVRVEIASLSLVPSGGGTCAIVLREADGERFLPVVIGLLEAQAIAVKIQGMPTPRPLTHDLLGAVLAALHGKLVRVTIDNVREGTFYATIEIDREGSVIKIDARPSDAIALAVRAGAPVFVSESVMDAAGASPENVTQIPVQPTSSVEPADAAGQQGAAPEGRVSAVSRVADLEDEMKAAIRDENYERAAQIRDEIGRLRASGTQE